MHSNRQTLAVTRRAGFALAIMLAAAAIVYTLSRGHVFFFPFLLILGVPLALLFRKPPPLG